MGIPDRPISPSRSPSLDHRARQSDDAGENR
jgi:hypothetical protein